MGLQLYVTFKVAVKTSYLIRHFCNSPSRPSVNFNSRTVGRILVMANWVKMGHQLIRIILNTTRDRKGLQETTARDCRKYQLLYGTPD